MTFLQLLPFCLLFSLGVIGVGYWMAYQMIYDAGYLSGMTEEHKQRAAVVLAARQSGFHDGQRYEKSKDMAFDGMDQHDVANAIMEARSIWFPDEIGYVQHQKKIEQLRTDADQMLDGLQQIPKP